MVLSEVCFGMSGPRLLPVPGPPSDAVRLIAQLQLPCECHRPYCPRRRFRVASGLALRAFDSFYTAFVQELRVAGLFRWIHIWGSSRFAPPCELAPFAFLPLSASLPT